MPQAVPRELLGFPPAVNRRPGRQPRFLTKPREQPIGLELQQVLAIPLGGILEGPLEQRDITEVERLKGRRGRRRLW